MLELPRPSGELNWLLFELAELLETSAESTPELTFPLDGSFSSEFSPVVPELSVSSRPLTPLVSFVALHIAHWEHLS